MELTVKDALLKGVEAHKAGKLQEADQFYTAILKSQPNHPDANHNMGVLAVGLDKVEEALPFFKKALEVNPGITQFWLSLIDALIKLERFEEAKGVLEQAKDKGAKGAGLNQLEERLLPEGQIKEANSKVNEAEGTQPNILDTLKIDKALRLAEKKLKEGFSVETERIYQDILAKFPNNKKAKEGLKALSGNPIGKTSKTQSPSQDELKSLIELYGQGQFQKALNYATELLKQFPNSVILHNIFGAANAGLKRYDAAIESYKQALKIKSDYADAYLNMGNALKGKGDLEEAIDSYKKALKIKPDYADAYYNIGNALKGKGDLEEAIDSYNKALKIKPDYAEAYSNMGIALSNKGDLEEAIESYKKALKIKPDYAKVYNNMGNALKDKRDLEKAIDSYNKALKIIPNYAEAYYNLGGVLKEITFIKPNPEMQEVITSMLQHKNYIRPRDILKASLSLLRLEPSMQSIFSKISQGDLEKSLQDIILDLSELPLLLKLMSLCPFSDLKWEAFLANLRSNLLFSINNIKGSSKFTVFQSALALQCFTNEYIYYQTDSEAKALKSLEFEIKQTLSDGQQPSSKVVLCLAAYKALHEYEWCELLNVTTEIKEVYQRQVIEPKEERLLIPKIKIFKKITDAVSSKVREQYEKHPYPRWVNLALTPTPASISTITAEINLKLFNPKVAEVEAPNILVAGCGTGLHPLGTASRFRNSEVLAVDLSLSSLCYAKRKTEELSVKNIEYMQADILDISKIGKQFDIIESVGVLHHMDDPMAGWRVLVNCLKPGGLMRIGLYSEIARKQIMKLKKEINYLGIGSNNEAMRSFRNDIINLKKENHRSIFSLGDFYSLSEWRDLLFHIKEHHFTLPQIRTCLDELGLFFCGFESDKIVQKFKLNNSDANDPYNLEKWNTFELSNPQSFSEMYQFWCQKVI